MQSYQYIHSHHTYNTASRPSYYYNINPLSGKTVFILRRCPSGCYDIGNPSRDTALSITYFSVDQSFINCTQIMAVFCAKFQNACTIKADCSGERDFARFKLTVCFGWVFYMFIETVLSILYLYGSRITSMSTGQYILRQMFSFVVLPLIIKLPARMSFAECTQQSFWFP